MNEKQVELYELGRTVNTTSEIALENIKRYNELHCKGEILTGSQPQNMKLVEDADGELRAVLDLSIGAAVNNLKRYLEAVKKGESGGKK